MKFTLANYQRVIRTDRQTDRRKAYSSISLGTGPRKTENAAIDRFSKHAAGEKVLAADSRTVGGTTVQLQRLTASVQVPIK